MSDEIYPSAVDWYLDELTEAHGLDLHEWLGFHLATAKLKVPGEPLPLLDFLKRGLVRARFLRGFIACSYLEDVGTSNEFLAHEKLISNAPYSSSWTFGEKGLSRKFWSRTSPVTVEGWKIIPSFPHTEFCLSNWSDGHFGLLQYPHEQGGSWLGIHLEVYGVEFLASDLEAVAPSSPSISPNPMAERAKKYRWEEAIAAFAAYHDKHGVFDDLYAPGTQAAIEKHLSQWFQDRGAEPSESSVRNKAQMLIEAFKAADAQGAK